MGDELATSIREHPDVHPGILEAAIVLAKERGGQTTPVSDYDIQHASDLASAEQSENARLRAELRAVKAELAALRLAPPTPQPGDGDE